MYLEPVGDNAAPVDKYSSWSHVLIHRRDLYIEFGAIPKFSQPQRVHALYPLFSMPSTQTIYPIQTPLVGHPEHQKKHPKRGSILLPTWGITPPGIRGYEPWWSVSSPKDRVVERPFQMAELHGL